MPTVGIIVDLRYDFQGTTGLNDSRNPTVLMIISESGFQNPIDGCISKTVIAALDYTASEAVYCVSCIACHRNFMEFEAKSLVLVCPDNRNLCL